MSGENTSFGLPENVESALAYLMGFVSGGIIYALEKENKNVKFHAMQSVMTSVLLCVLSVFLSFIPFIGWIMLIPLSFLGLILMIFLLFKAFTGEKFKLPIIGDFAEKTSGS
ncbi:MAG: DUF4870 domain-containing protein [Candidatus Riflebacteria bacterium]|nr:DUF4870 domain-containing protein [Candidatus Riflebacteria bacterium]